MRDFNATMHSYKIIITGKHTPLPGTVHSQGFSGHYSAYFKSDNDAVYSVNQWLHSHEILFKVPTGIGRNTTRIMYQAQLVATNNTEGDISNFSTRFSGDRHELLIGDDVLSYSELMSPGLVYQGARF